MEGFAIIQAADKVGHSSYGKIGALQDNYYGRKWGFRI
jgi:hypothetical protein